ncbi:MAG: GNAT family N-acetyltransferase [Chloroflexi bacterium]|nr:MAG: GNAT family N-acetyltransferase [Chloroflexota bacterium]
MELTTYVEPADFLTQTQAVLEQEETVNSLMLGIVVRLRDQPDFVESTPYLSAVLDDGRLVAAATMTPPYNVIVASDQPDYPAAFALVVDDLVANERSVPGVNGPVPLSASFAEIWSAVTGQPYTLQMHMRAFELQQVDHPPYPPGKLRLATSADKELLVQWVTAFGFEALHEPDQDLERAYQGVERALRHQNFFVWDDNGPVSLAGRARPTRRGITIGPVYTPPEFRHQGYATALVAALSQRLLDEGKQFVTLFTDLANPTSNSIYQKIGFRPVRDFIEYRFGQPGPP